MVEGGRQTNIGNSHAGLGVAAEAAWVDSELGTGAEAGPEAEAVPMAQHSC